MLSSVSFKKAAPKERERWKVTAGEERRPRDSARKMEKERERERPRGTNHSLLESGTCGDGVSEIKQRENGTKVDGKYDKTLCTRI